MNIHQFHRPATRKWNHALDKKRTSRFGHAIAMTVSLLLTVAVGPLVANANPAEPFFEMQEVFQGQRFPSIVTAVDGTVLAFRAQNSPIQVRRSEDGGKTWGAIIQVGTTAGLLGAAVVDDRSGDVLVFGAEPGERMYRSADHGKTWRRSEHTIEPDGFGGIGGTHGSDSGITLRYGPREGRLLMPARVYPPGMDNSLPWRPYIYNSAIYSDDGGKTWRTSLPFPILGTGEGTLAELSDGTIYYNSRKHMPGTVHRRIAWSHDGGHSWRNATIDTNLYDGGGFGQGYGCAAGLVRLPLEWTQGHDVLLFSNTDTQGGARERMTVWASFDHGKTWPVKRLVYEGPAAYSSMATGRPGTPSDGLIYLQFEGGPGGMYSAIQVARFNLAWLTSGRGTHGVGEPMGSHLHN